jgi:MinD-like ATPase involved in chromosome partitioning or flagellar assembly
VILGAKKERMLHTLTDFLFGRCEIEEATYDLSAELGLGEKAGAGALFLLPSSLSVEAITRVVSEGYDVAKLNDRFSSLLEALRLDFLFLDTHPGLCRETMLTSAISDTLLIVIRPDQQDFHGTAVLIEVASRLSVPSVYMVVNFVLGSVDREKLKQEMEKAFGYEVVGLLPLANEMISLGSRDLFTRKHPKDSLSVELEAVAERLLSGPAAPKKKPAAGQTAGATP